MRFATSLAAGALAAACLLGLQTVARGQQPDPQATEGANHDGWTSITGTIRQVDATSFVLGRDGRVVTVDMRDYGWYGSGSLESGDRVTVIGATGERPDGVRTVEPSSVYVEKLDTYFYVRPADAPAGFYSKSVVEFDSGEEWAALTGTVQSVDGDVVIRTGAGQKVTVGTANVPYQVDLSEGDRVTVYGDVRDAASFDDRRIEANSVIVLEQR